MIMTELPSGIDGGAERKAAGYKSWKKKYRKMRIVFDHKMHECEELHKQEAKAAATVKRIAIENDRLLELLLEVNNSPQIPPERRIDLALKPPTDSKTPCLAIDREYAMRKDSAMKKLDQMMHDVPHPTYISAKESDSPLLRDLAVPEGENFPANFLSANDVDDYIYSIDMSINPDSRAPTLAPLAHPSSHPVPPPQLQNPTSVTNWLRKYAPKIFLQDGEAHDGEEAPESTGSAAAAAASAAPAASAAATGPGTGGGHSSAKKSRSSGGGSKAERSSTAKTSAKSKRSSIAARASLATTDRGDWDASLDDDLDFGSTPVSRGKRKRDEDQGYKPRGSSSRPSKKKRKNDVEATPTIRKSSKKDAHAASKNDS